jgi:hypothetical protein
MNTHFKTFLFYSIVLGTLVIPFVFNNYFTFTNNFNFFISNNSCVSSIPIPTWVEIPTKAESSLLYLLCFRKCWSIITFFYQT